MHLECTIIPFQHIGSSSLTCIIFRDISDNPLVCDCEMSGFLEWVRKKLRLGPKSECYEPATLKGTLIRSLRLDMLNCARPKSNVTPEIEIIPDANLVSKQFIYIYLK